MQWYSNIHAQVSTMIMQIILSTDSDNLKIYSPVIFN